jgi:phosphoesterase RecJ-like protein
MFKEQDDGSWRVSLRSKGPNVGALARSRGGGGHDLAAGFSSEDVDQTVAELIADLK